MKENVNQLLVSISGIVTMLVAVWVGFEACMASGFARLLSDVKEVTATTITLATSVVVGSWPYLPVIGGVVALFGMTSKANWEEIEGSLPKYESYEPNRKLR